MDSTSVIKPEVVSFGCRLNTAEGERMMAHAVAAGLDDVIIFNTCAVTAEAVAQARQAIRKAKRARPTARIVVTGCAAQIAPEKFAALPEVDHVFGNSEKLAAETYAGLVQDLRAPRVAVADILQARTVGALGSPTPRVRGRRVRAHVPVQTGCDHRCTFCIIPFGRGPSRSVPADAVIADIRRLVEDGVHEVVLTGVDMTSYGADFNSPFSLGQLVQRILREVPDLPRLRLSSVDTIEIDTALMTAFADNARLMPHMHLSLQHGADLILKRMKRRHSRQIAIDQCAVLRRLRPDIVFGADLIAGFPTETEGHFRDTLDLIDACDLTWVHVFPYSAREGTPAARMPQLDGRVIKERARMLRLKGERARLCYHASLDGTTTQLLTEHDNRARTATFAEVRIDAPPGQLVTARVTHARDAAGNLCETGRLIGERVDLETAA